jgi:hypothetical protein
VQVSPLLQSRVCIFLSQQSVTARCGSASRRAGTSSPSCPADNGSSARRSRASLRPRGGATCAEETGFAEHPCRVTTHFQTVPYCPAKPCSRSSRHS